MSEYSNRPGQRPSYRISEDASEVAKEQQRLDLLGDMRDRRGAALLDTLGLKPGWRCLDVGSGGGSLARWMAERVSPGGSVLSTDIDVRFQGESQSNLEVRQHDVVLDPLPAETFDLVHIRAVLQTIEQREAVLDKLVAAMRPGGWLVVEDPEWSSFERQPLPPAFRALYDAMMAIAAEHNGYDRHWAVRVPEALRNRGLTAIDLRAEASAMRGGTETAEWLLLAYERAAPGLIAAGLLEAGMAEAGLEAGRDPAFFALGPLAVTCWGQKPLRPGGVAGKAPVP